MIKDVLVYSITLMNIKRTFNMIKKNYRSNRAQMNSEIVKEFIIVKHYNRKINRTKNNIFIKS